MKYIFYFIIGLYFFSVPLDGITQKYMPFSNFSRIVSIGIIIFYLFSLLKFQKIYLSKTLIPLILFICWGIFTLLWDDVRAMKEIFNFLSLFFTSFVIIQIVFIYKLRISINAWLYVLGCVIASLSTLMFGDMLGGNRFTIDESLNPNIFSSFLAIGIFCLMILWSEMKKPIKPVLVIIGSLLFLVIILSQSRTALISILLSIILVIVISFLSNRKSFLEKFNLLKFLKGILVSGIVISTFSIFIIVSFENLNLSFNDLERFNKSYENSSEFTSGRTEIWENHLIIWKDNLFFGHGMESARYLHQEYYGQVRKVHNAYIKVLVEVGLIGFTMFIMMFFYMFKIVKKSNNSKLNNPMLFIISFLIFASLGNDIFNYAYSWIGIVLFHWIILERNSI